MKTKASLTPERLFRALSDGTRLRILSLLSVRELCVCDLVSALDVPQPTASRHLSYLRKVGLVTVRKDGVWCFYAAAPPQNEFQKKLWACIAACKDAKQMGDDLERIRQARLRCCP